MSSRNHEPALPIRLTPSGDERGYKLFLGYGEKVPGTLDIIGQRFAEAMQEYPALNVLGLARSGLRQVARPGLAARDNARDELQEFWVPEPRSPHFRDTSNALAVVDNSINTGILLDYTVRWLHERTVRPEVFVKLIDYDDEEERYIKAQIDRELGMRTISLFHREEVMSSWQKQAAKLLQTLPWNERAIFASRFGDGGRRPLVIGRRALGFAPPPRRPDHPMGIGG